MGWFSGGYNSQIISTAPQQASSSWAVRRNPFLLTAQIPVLGRDTLNGQTGSSSCEATVLTALLLCHHTARGVSSNPFPNFPTIYCCLCFHLVSEVQNEKDFKFKIFFLLSRKGFFVVVG